MSSSLSPTVFRTFKVGALWKRMDDILSRTLYTEQNFGFDNAKLSLCVQLWFKYGVALFCGTLFQNVWSSENLGHFSRSFQLQNNLRQCISFIRRSVPQLSFCFNGLPNQNVNISSIPDRCTFLSSNNSHVDFILFFALFSQKNKNKSKKPEETKSRPNFTSGSK